MSNLFGKDCFPFSSSRISDQLVPTPHLFIPSCSPVLFLYSGESVVCRELEGLKLCIILSLFHRLFCPRRVFLSMLFLADRRFFLGIAFLILPFPFCHTCCVTVCLAAKGTFSSWLPQSGLTYSRLEIAGQERAAEKADCHYSSKFSHQRHRQ